ncbi:hypothetical protein ACLB2K_065891 [Fragaria x ananassa]
MNDLVATKAEIPENKEVEVPEPEAPFEVVDEAPATTEISRGVPKKRRSSASTLPKLASKLTSMVWQHLTKFFLYDTSTLRRHIKKVCKKYAGRKSIYDRQAMIAGDGEAKPKMELQKVWTNDHCVQGACEMIVIDELPFSHVKNEGFRHLYKVVVPQFTPPSRRAVVRCFWKLYE